MVFFLRLLIMLSAAGLAWMSGEELWQRQQLDVFFLGRPLLQQANDLQNRQQWPEAKMLAEFVLDNAEFGDPNEAKKVLQRVDEELDSYWGQVQRFAEGAISGEPYDTASFLGSLSLDFFVLGDIRDLVVQGWKSATGEDGDEVIMALSTIGLVTTVAPYLDWIPGLLKALKRTGKLSRPLGRQLKQLSTRAIKTGDTVPLRRLLGDTATTVEKMGPGPFAGIAHHIESATDMRKIANASTLNPHATYVLVSNFGTRGIKTIGKNGKNIGRVVDNIRVASRLVKTADKSISALPAAWLNILLVISAGICLFSIAYQFGPKQKKSP